ncbi:hypothetical protein KIN20_019019 [Parelaphostrongylus tenuis]|uniref:Uncharacterized protein n=1 Tax=Parelaphostrongylus tenuis TaxID=148309 RepID=A0AAD5N861_PARTN|nr:hypothetical protein KIN20_019019 [Parelaphostrongylus tenuis]
MAYQPVLQCLTIVQMAVVLQALIPSCFLRHVRLVEQYLYDVPSIFPTATSINCKRLSYCRCNYYLSTVAFRMTTANPQRQCQVHRKFTTEKLPPPLSRRDERIRSMTCSFEEIAESEEEDVQLPEPRQTGRSPFAVQSPFAQRRGISPNYLSPTLIRRSIGPQLCRGFSDPIIRRSKSFTSTSLSPDRHDSSAELLTLPPIPETSVSSSSSDYKGECD